MLPLLSIAVQPRNYFFARLLLLCRTQPVCSRQHSRGLSRFRKWTRDDKPRRPHVLQHRANPLAADMSGSASRWRRPSLRLETPDLCYTRVVRQAGDDAGLDGVDGGRGGSRSPVAAGCSSGGAPLAATSVCLTGVVITSRRILAIAPDVGGQLSGLAYLCMGRGGKREGVRAGIPRFFRPRFPFPYLELFGRVQNGWCNVCWSRRGVSSSDVYRD